MENRNNDLIEIDKAIISEKTLQDKLTKKIKKVQVLESLPKQVKQLEQKATVQDITITSKKRFIGPIIIFIKKIYLKINRWVLKIYLNQQNDFNRSTVNTLNTIVELLKDDKQ